VLRALLLSKRQNCAASSTAVDKWYMSSTRPFHKGQNKNPSYDIIMLLCTVLLLPGDVLSAQAFSHRSEFKPQL
jgi:hypothetical protein